MLTKSVIISLLCQLTVRCFEVEPEGYVSKEFCIMHRPSGMYLNTAKTDDGKKVVKLQRKEDSEDKWVFVDLKENAV